MILDGNERTRYNVTNEMHIFTFQDEKSYSRYNTPDQPPSYETLFATPSTPSSSNSIATRSTIVQQPTTNSHFLPCVVPRKPSLAMSLHAHIDTLQKYPNPLAAPMQALLREPTHHPSKPITSPNQTSWRSSTASTKSSSQTPSSKASAPQARSCRCFTARP